MFILMLREIYAKFKHYRLDGNVNMGNETLNLLLTAKPKNFSPLTVRSPVKVSGTFLNPIVSVAKTPIAARVIGSVLAFINPLAAVIPFLDPGAKTEANDAACLETLNNLKKSHAK